MCVCVPCCFYSLLILFCSLWARTTCLQWKRHEAKALKISGTFCPVLQLSAPKSRIAWPFTSKFWQQTRVSQWFKRRGLVLPALVAEKNCCPLAIFQMWSQGNRASWRPKNRDFRGAVRSAAATAENRAILVHQILQCSETNLHFTCSPLKVFSEFGCHEMFLSFLRTVTVVAVYAHRCFFNFKGLRHCGHRREVGCQGKEANVV